MKGPATLDGLAEGPLVSTMLERDLDEVHAIAASCFPRPWPRTALANELSLPCAILRVLRAEAGGTVYAFATAWHFAGELHIHNIATLPEARRRGYATTLTRALIDRNRAQIVLLEVRISNEAAQRMYRGLGFRVRGLRRGYYADNGEHALQLELRRRSR
ncbi:MAG: ribosomal protein S18-alanine N-acetyltransferase [Proteobacteria bacterium]|nr:ribosomal protein S18-alanine N-acetyltransferase [Pseudomonadota bacterium]